MAESEEKRSRRVKGLNEEKGEESLSAKLAESSAGPCPVIPEHIQKIMSTVDRLDKSEIDELGAVEEISGILKERKKQRLRSLLVEPTEPAETSEASGPPE